MPAVLPGGQTLTRVGSRRKRSTIRNTIPLFEGQQLQSCWRAKFTRQPPPFPDPFLPPSSYGFPSPPSSFNMKVKRVNKIAIVCFYHLLSSQSLSINCLQSNPTKSISITFPFPLTTPLRKSNYFLVDGGQAPWLHTCIQNTCFY